MAGVARGVNIFGDYAPSGTTSFLAARRNPLIDHSKSTKGRAAFILPSQNRSYSVRNQRAAPFPVATKAAWRKGPLSRQLRSLW